MLVCTRDVYLCFIKMQYWSIQELAQEPILSTSVVFGEILHETLGSLQGQLFRKEIKYGF